MMSKRGSRGLALASIIWVLCLGSVALAQSPEGMLEQTLQAANQDRLSLNQSGMVVLLSWAALNIGTGAAGWAMTEHKSQWQGFHQMNLGWGIINLGIGILAYTDAASSPTQGLGVLETLGENAATQNIFWFNTGLDVGYMMAGVYLWERGRRLEADRTKGFGKSVIMQGAFLFAFDLTMALLQRGSDAELKIKLEPLIEASGQGAKAAVSWVF